MSTSLKKNVWILTIAQALMMSAASLVVFVGGIVGAKLAPEETLSTLPVASIVIGTAIATVPVAMTMKALGRKKTFLLFAILGILAAFLAAYSITNGSFILFCISSGLIGVMIASTNHFRFAAMESVEIKDMPKAASTVLLGGIAAAFIGPEIAVYGKNLFKSEFSGSFILLAVLFTIGFLIILLFQNTTIKQDKGQSKGRPLWKIISQPVFLVAVAGAMFGYAIMSFIMTATPVSMHTMDGHSLHHTKWVIQSHIVSMFVPSLIVPFIIARIGVPKLMYGGLLAYILCIAVALNGHDLWNYWMSLILLGIGWNFLFVGGTSLLPLSYKPEEKFRVQAVNELMVFSTQAAAALSAGYVVYHLGWEIVLWINLPVMLVPLGALINYQISSKE
ncbi:MFS transporter [Reichenbachiella versicolor]|uniref:MFS transporter n=1 Tax=Reichenbachiella versicolor TaxID=1821036 RepID=UPI000D6E7F23|nr:MFS transporter [Reichenbachiella versicolor]